MEINKDMLSVKEQSVKIGSNVMVEGDIIIPDIKPDVSEVLLADAVASIKSTEVRNGKVAVSGSVHFQILYKPDDTDCELKSVSAVFPFSDTLEVSGNEDAEYQVCAETEHIGFSLVNSRKLSMKVIVAVVARGYSEKTLAPISVVSGDAMQCRSTEYNIYMPVCEQHCDIPLSDLLTVPAHYPDIEEILTTDAWAGDAQCKIMNGKVMVRGTLHTRTLYVAANESASVQQVQHEIPFTEIIEADQVDETCNVAVTFSVKQLTANPRGDMNGDTKIINADAIVHAVLKASKSVQQTLLDDCYTTQGTVETKKRQTTLTEFVAHDTLSFTESQKAALPAKVKVGEILSVSCKPILRETIFENHILVMRGSLVTFLLYREHKDDGKGAIKSAVTETPFERTKAMTGENLFAECDIWGEETTASINGDGSVDISIALGMNLCALRSVDASFITECEWQDTDTETRAQPALIIYFTEEGDTLWSVAKKYGTTVEKIKHANGLEEETLAGGRKILIPKAV